MAVSVGLALGFTGTTAVIVGGAVIMAGSMIVTSAMMPDMPSFDNDQLGSNGTQTNAVTPNGDHEIVYGEVRKGGVTTFQEVTNSNQFLHQVVIVAGHEVEAIGDIYLNGELSALDANGMVTGGKYANKVWIYKHLGDQTTADSGLVSATSVGSNFVNQGLAYIYMKCEYDPDVFTAGVPVVTAKVKGKKVYNPDTGTTAWSDNPALCIRDYLNSDYGFKVPTEHLDDTTFNAAFTACDASLGSGLDNKMRCNGSISCGATYEDNIKKLLSTCQGTLFWSQGYWKLKVGVYYAPSVSLDEGNLRGSIGVSTKSSRANQFNRVQGQFADQDQAFILADYPMVTSSVFLTEDGGAGNENAMSLDLPLTTSSTSAQRLAKLSLYRSREQITVNADFDMSAMEVEIGDTVNLSIERYGWTNKIFEVVGWTFNGGEKGSTVSLDLKETSSAAYSWDDEEVTIVSNNTSLTDIDAGLAVSNLSASDTVNTQTDGTTIDGLEVTFDAAASAMVDFYEVQWKPNASSGYATAFTRDLSYTIEPIRNVLYDIRVRAVTVNGNKGAFSNTTATGGGDTTAPALPTSISATGAQGAITIEWTNPVDADLRYIDVYENSVDDSASATRIGSSSGSNFFRPNLGDEVTKYYWLKSVDLSGNESGFTSSVNATSNTAIVSKGGGLYRAELTSGDTIDYTVTASGGQYFLDGKASPAIELLEGYTYKFDLSDSSNSGHPLRFSTTSDGTHNSGTEYTTGVTTNGTAGTSGAYVQIAVATGAPALYYYCENHSGMGDAVSTPATKTTAVLNKLFQYAYGSTAVVPAQADRLLINDDEFLNEEVAYIFNGIGWDEQTAFIDGNFLVTGTITGDKLSANSISALGLTIGTLSDSSTGERITISDSQILVHDASNVVRVKIGDLS